MKEARHNGNYFLLYDSIQELPVERFFKFNLQIALDAGIGADLSSIMERNKELREWIRRNRKKEAMQALFNMETAVNMLVSSVNPETNAFVCLVHSCNGIEVDDLSQEGMTRYLAEWSKRGLTIGKLKGWVAQAKKNFSHEVSQFFPETGGGAQAIERANLLKKRTLAALKFMQGTGNESDVKKYDNILIEFVRPNVYGGSKGVEVTRTNAFEDALVVIQKELNIGREMTAHQFLKHSATVKEIIANRKRRKQNG